MGNIFQLWPQILMTFLCNISILSFGLQATWLSALQPALQSENSPLGIPPLTDDQISWIGALPSIAITVGAPFYGWTMDRFGRKTTLFLATAPNILTYLLLIFADNVYIVYVSRLIGGFCSGGAFMVGPVYIAECSEPKLKGTFSGLSGFFVKVGMILSFLLGPFISYNALNIFSALFTVFFLLMFAWMPESPAHLLKLGKVHRAEGALKTLWRSNCEDEIIAELKSITKNLKDSKTSQWKIWKSFVTEGRLRSGCFICVVIFTFQMISGYPALVRYAVDIISDTGTGVSPYLAAIILAASQLTSAFFGALLLDKLGRKTFAVSSLALMGTCLSIVSGYLFLKESYPENNILSKISFLPIIALALFMGSYSAGFGTVPFAMVPVLFSSGNRGTASTILNIWSALVEFLVIKTFYTIRNWTDLPGALAIFAVTAYFGAVTVSRVMFRTEGLTFEAVQMKLSGAKIDKNHEQSKMTLLQTKS